MAGNKNVDLIIVSVILIAMKIITDISAFTAEREMIVSIGNFDGVHAGHASLIRTAVAMAKERGAESGFVTFDPHPMKFFGADIKLLQTSEMKYREFERLGADYLFVIRFDNDFADMTAEDFVRNILLKKMKAVAIVVGYDYKFGRERCGTYEFLCELGRKEGFEAVQVPKVVIDGVTASSTNIRRLLAEGDPAAAALLLGRNYVIGGKVVRGDGIASGIGFPTANIKVENELVPMNGIYAAFVIIDGKRYYGALYIGERPTVQGAEGRRVEINVFDFSGNLYGKYIEAEVVELIRHDIKFNSIDELSEQIKADCIKIRVFFEKDR